MFIIRTSRTIGVKIDGHSRSSYGGFSLIELSIVLVILGLLVAAALTGKELLKAAELRAIISEVEDYKIQVDNFVTQYNGLPGDIDNAQDFFGGATDDGDDNGRIGTAGGDGSELFDAWQQMSLGRFIPGEFDGGGTDADLDTNVPRSSYASNAGYSLVWHNAPGGWRDALNRYFSGNVIIFATDDTTENILEGAVLLPEDAFSIDLKIDNEQPDFGKVLAENGDGLTGCTTVLAPNDAEYDFTSPTHEPLCRLYFHLQ